MDKEKLHVSVDVLVYEDGTFGAVSKDIDGLVLECPSLGELETELLLVAPLLLKTNHGLTDDEISGSVLNVRFMKGEDDMPAPVTASLLRLVYPDAPQQYAIA